MIIVYLTVYLSLTNVIVKSEDVEELYPFIVSLVCRSHKKICTGSLLNRNWVVTAAHCLTQPVHYITYRNPIKNSTSIASILKKYPHPAYRKHFRNHIFQNFYTNNDIGLMQVSNIYLKAYAVLSSMPYQRFKDMPVKCVGGRLRAVDSEKVVRVLNYKDGIFGQSAEGKIVDCENPEQWGPGVCTAPKCIYKFNIDNGNSGGPLMVKDRIIGIATFRSSQPTERYTPVSLYLSWVKKVTRRVLYL